MLSVTGNVITNSTLGAMVSQQIYTYSGDPLLRDYQVVDLANRTNQYHFGCCEMDSTTDPDGVSTVYGYDTLKRRISTTVFRGTNGITTSNILDAAGHVLLTQRIGTDGSVITLSQFHYDVLGRVMIQTNALNGVTTTTNVMVSNQLIITNTYPDGGTSTETYYRDGRLQSIAGTAVHPIQYQYGAEQDGSGGPWRRSTLATKLSATGGTNEWTKTYIDGAGQGCKTIYAGASTNAYSLANFNGLGQVTNKIDPDGVSTLYTYNPKGEQALTAVDMNQNGTIDFFGPDRISFVTNDVVNLNGTNVNRTQLYVWSTNSSVASNLITTTESSVDGLQGWNIAWNAGVGITKHSQTVYGTNAYRYVTNTSPDSSYSVSVYQYGELLSVTARDANGVQLSQTTCGYDPHGRQSLITDARNGTITNYFNNADQISGMVTPAPGPGQSAQVTSNYFDNMGRIFATQLPDNTWVTNIYNQAGDLVQTYGSQTYATGYGHDAQGRKTSMTNWTAAAAGTGARVTTWNYDLYRGFLTGKTYDSGTIGPSYTYTSAGRLLTRLWARGTNTTYSYNNAGGLSGTTYNDGATPALTCGYDRRGRQTAITNGTSVTTRAYNDAGNLLSESYSGGPQDGLSITNGYDTLLRRTNLVVFNPSNLLYSATYGYDAASRLLTVCDGTNSAGYSYLTNSPLVSQISFTNSGALRMTTTKAYDYLNRLTSISSANASSVVLDSHSYAYNTANQRTSVTNTDSSRWAYGYDPLGQITSGVKSWSDGTPAAGEQFGYTFDDIGNRTSTSAGGDEWGANLRYASYSANNLNQYTSRNVPGAVDILGEATNTSTVTINNQPTYRHGTFYRDQLSLPNSAASVWQPVTNLAVLYQGTNADIIATNIGNVFLPMTPEDFTYDLDGNLTQDGRWTYTWDGENRLIGMQALSTVPNGAKFQLGFAYDYQGRRIAKITENYNGSTWNVTVSNKFAYDGWNLVAELNATNNTLIRSYMWGFDLSGSMQGAGGAGGLLKLTCVGAATTNCFVAFDGNGNVGGLVNVVDGTLIGQYEFSPFGELIRATGPMAKANPVRFSSKYQDDESDLLYYGYRYYNASVGRWSGRDPIEERGGVNIYEFGRNAPPSTVDVVGLQLYPPYGPLILCSACPCRVICTFTITSSDSNTYGNITFETITFNFQCTDCIGRQSTESHTVKVEWIGDKRILPRNPIDFPKESQSYTNTFMIPCISI